jgi:hypothetical protein
MVRVALPVVIVVLTPVGAVVTVCPVEEVYHVIVPGIELAIFAVVTLQVVEPAVPCVSGVFCKPGDDTVLAAAAVTVIEKSCV